MNNQSIEGNNAEEVINAFREKNRNLAVSNAKGQAADKLKNLDNSEKEALTLMKQAKDKVGDPKKLYELLQILALAES